jgi:hypothetical protein
MGGEDEAFAMAVLSCVEEVGALLPALAERFPERVVQAALADHIAGALRLCVRNGMCTPAQARGLLSRMREAAFPRPR